MNNKSKRRNCEQKKGLVLRKDILRRMGFTLIELLVVIAIIALLMAILMPALQRVKKQAKTVACLSLLKQWGLYFTMYTQENDGYFMQGLNRHKGFVNSLFLDWSARKVGLKELWTMRWHRSYNTASPWTVAGGVQPGDWPQWMKHIKDF